MKVLVIHNEYQIRGGEDSVVAAEIALLQAAGHRVVTHFRSNSEIAPKSLIQTAALAANTIWSRESIRGLQEVIRRVRPEIAHFHNTFPLISPSAYSACRDAGIPVVQTLHNYRLVCPAANLFREGRSCEDCIRKWGAWPGIIHGCYRGSRATTGVVAAMLAIHRELGTWHDRVDCFISPSAFARQKFVEGGLPSGKILVKPHFIHPDPGHRSAQGEFAICVGRLSEEKGLQRLLQAWKLAGVTLPLRIVGEGPLVERLQFERDRLGLASVHFDGHLDRRQVFEMLKRANFLVLPSECYETFSMTIAEAAACGVPAIATHHGAIAEIVDDRRTGLLFKPTDAEDLASKIVWALQHPDSLAEMGRAARAKFDDEYTAERNLPQLLSIYERAGARSGVITPLERRLATAKRRGVIKSLTVSRRSFMVLGVRVNALQIPDVIKDMLGWIQERKRCHTIAVTGMHGVMEAQHDPAFKDVLNRADAVVPDGMPLVWLGRLRGLVLPRRVYGPELMLSFCQQAATKNYRHFFYGGAAGQPEKLADLFRNIFPGLQVAGAFSPPFRPLTLEEDAEIVSMINAATPDILWVGLGTPKQETWIQEHRERLQVPVAIGVGAAFDIHAGTKAQAPVWMREHGLEWLFRLAHEPRRLWRRYLVYGSEFVVRVGFELIGLGRTQEARQAPEQFLEAETATSRQVRD
jgi:exopolysaccharide biosynthesis WecB/TagA/CpsF family protein